MAHKRGCLNSFGCVLTACAILGGGYFLCGGCFTLIDSSVHNLQKQIDINYGEPGELWSEMHVRQISEAAVKKCLQHPLGATFSRGEPRRLINDEIESGKVAWTCTGTVTSPTEFGPGVTKDWTAVVVLTDKKAKTWQPVLVRIGDETYSMKTDK